MPSIITAQRPTPGVIATIRISRELIKFAAQKSVVRAETSVRTDHWPVYSQILIATTEEVGQLLGGN